MQVLSGETASKRIYFELARGKSNLKYLGDWGDISVVLV